MKKFNRQMLKALNNSIDSQNKRVNEAVELNKVSKRNLTELGKYGVEI